MKGTAKAIFFRELTKIFSNSRVALLLLLGPFFYLMLFGGVYWSGQVREIPLTVIDLDNSQLSREITAALASSESLQPAYYCRSLDAFRRLTDEGKSPAAIVFPYHFEREVKAGRQARALAVLNGENILIANVANRALQGVFQTYQGKIKVLRQLARGVPRRLALTKAFPLQAEFRILFNPTYHYGFYLLLGLVCIALQQVTMMGAAIALTLDGKLSGPPLSELAGRFGAHALVMLPLGCFSASLPFLLFGAPFRGSWPLLLLITALFTLISILTGFWVGGICREPLLSAQVLLCLSVPFFVLTGYTWPSLGMPGWVQQAALVLPLTHFAVMAKRISLTGAGLSDCLPGLLALTAWLLAALGLAAWGIKRLEA